MTPEDVFEMHKPIRNRIREFEPHSLLRCAMTCLHERVDSKPPDQWGGYLPWTLLLIIRWTFLYAAHGRRVATEKDLIELHNAVHNLDDSFTLPDQGDRDTVSAFMGRTLFTQLQFQRLDYELRGISRQLVMFEHHGQALGIDSTFQSLYGLTIREFMRIFYVCWAGKPATYSVAYFQGMFPETKIQAFFDCLSVDFDAGKQFIRDYTQAGATIQFQLYEQSPLKLKPFFRSGEKWSAFSYRLLNTSLLESIYDLLRRDVPNFTAQMFGPVFERYLGNTIGYYSDQRHETEVDLKRKLPKGSKTTDFLIEEDTSAIFVEAKGTELHLRAQVCQSRETILMNTRSTTLKAVVQCQETACKLVNSGKFPKKALFGLIVTYKEYLFGEGGHFWRDVIGGHVTAELAKGGMAPVIPPEHLFYISVADFDWLLAGAKQRNTTLAQVLTEVTERNRHPETRAVMLSQHLEKIWATHYEPPTLEAARQNFQTEMMDLAKVFLKARLVPKNWKQNLLDSYSTRII